MKNIWEPISATKIPSIDEVGEFFWHIRLPELSSQEICDAFEVVLCSKKWAYPVKKFPVNKSFGQVILGKHHFGKGPDGLYRPHFCYEDCSDCGHADPTDNPCDSISSNEKLNLFYMFDINNINNKADVVPRNNDGRNICYWCNIPTQLRGGGMYNVCPKCGR